MQKFTCTYEYVRDGISTEFANPGEYRISNYNEYIEQMIKNKRFKIINVNNMNSNPLLKNLLTKKELSQCIIFQFLI